MQLKEKKLSIYVIAFFIAIGLSSCGGGTPTEKTFSVKDVQISGDLAPYIKVVDGDYTLKYVENNTPKIAIKFELVQQFDNLSYIDKLYVILLDKSGATIDEIRNKGGFGGFTSYNSSEKEKLESLLKSGEIGKQITVTLGGNENFDDKDKIKSAMKETESFELVTSAILAKESSSSSSNWSSSSNYDDDDDEDDSSSKSSSNANFDAWLKDYEKFIDQYIRLYKKAMKGDMSALAEYAGLLSKAQNIGDKLGNADLTPEQATKFANLQMKLANAALEAMD